MLANLTVSRARELPADLEPFVQASLSEGFRFLQRLRDEWNSGVNRFTEPGEAFFVARHPASLAGVCGLNRDPYSSDPTWVVCATSTLQRVVAGRASLVPSCSRPCRPRAGASPSSASGPTRVRAIYSIEPWVSRRSHCPKLRLIRCSYPRGPLPNKALQLTGLRLSEIW